MTEPGGRIQDAFLLSAGGRVGVLWVSSFGLVVNPPGLGASFCSMEHCWEGKVEMICLGKEEKHNRNKPNPDERSAENM